MPNLNPDTVVLEITVTRETASELKALVRERMWDPDVGLRMILSAGLGALAAEQMVEDGTDQDRIVRLSREVARAEGRLAAVRYELSEAHRALRQWELSSGAIRELALSLEKVVRRQAEELEELRARLVQANLEIEALRAAAARTLSARSA